MKRHVVPVIAVIFILTSGCMSSPPDLDGDGISDSEDLDIDGDGWGNNIELNCSTDPLISISVPSDIDGDLVCDFLDSDDDGDLWGDFTELDCSTDPLDNSSVPADYDEDMICDSLDKDADGDGLPNDGSNPGVSITWIGTTTSHVTERLSIVSEHMTISLLQRHITPIRPQKTGSWLE